MSKLYCLVCVQYIQCTAQSARDPELYILDSCLQSTRVPQINLIKRRRGWPTERRPAQLNVYYYNTPFLRGQKKQVLCLFP